MPPIAAALRNVFVWLGVAGTAMVAWGSTNPEYSFAGYWPNDTVMALGALVPIPLNRILIGGGTLLLSWAWWRLRPNGTSTVPPAWLVLALWSLPLLLVPPVLSNDAVLYADLGWITLNGLDPYTVGLASAGGPFAAQVDPLWAGSTVAYPPLTLLLDAGIVALSGADPYWSVVAMRIPVLASLVVIALLIPRIAVAMGMRPRGALWLGLLNPLLVLHFVGGAHNDAPMVALTLTAIWLVLVVPRTWMSLLVAPVVVGVAMAFKQQGGLAVVAVAGLPVAATLVDLPPVRRVLLLGWRTAVAALVTIATFVGICLASGLGFGWTGGLDLMGLAPTPAPLAALAKAGAALAGATGGDPEAFLRVAGLVGTAILAVVLAWILVVFADRPLAAVAWGSLAIAVLGQALHPWYLPWSLALLALVPLTRWQGRLVFGLALAFVNWNAIQTAIWHGVITPDS